MVDKGDWAEHELRSLDLGDKRLNRRMAKVVRDLAAKPQNSIPAASEGWAETHGAYRLFRNKKVTADKVLQPHIEQTMRRMANTSVALVLQDSLGGHLGRKCDGPPGPKSIWIGLHRTMEFALAWNTFGPGADARET